MALFFDSEWFERSLAAVHLSRADLARALGVSEIGIAEIWKDQRELSARDVAVIAALLGASAEEVATHAGISTPVPANQSGNSISELAARLDRVEKMLIEMRELLLDSKRSRT
jgi:transcriptional regulator with XRE-family HTH domain